MKKSFAIILAVVLLVGLVSIAYAAHTTSILCKTCGTYVDHVCDTESKTKTQVECPDGIVNCVCYEVETTHYYQCTVCNGNRVIRTTNYQHSK